MELFCFSRSKTSEVALVVQGHVLSGTSDVVLVPHGDCKRDVVRGSTTPSWPYARIDCAMDTNVRRTARRSNVGK